MESQTGNKSLVFWKCVERLFHRVLPNKCVPFHRNINFSFCEFVPNLHKFNVFFNIYDSTDDLFNCGVIQFIFQRMMAHLQKASQTTQTVHVTHATIKSSCMAKDTNIVATGQLVLKPNKLLQTHVLNKHTFPGCCLIFSYSCTNL